MFVDLVFRLLVRQLMAEDTSDDCVHSRSRLSTGLNT